MSDPIDIRSRPLVSVEQFDLQEVYKDDIEGILISKGEIESRIEKLATEIAADYTQKQGEILAICVLTGAMRFYVQLSSDKQIRFPFQVETIKADSYEKGTQSGGKVTFSGFNFSK